MISKMIGFGGPARQAWPLVTAEGLALVALVAVIDYLTGWEIAFHLFYLIPVAGVILWAGKWPGVAVAAVSALTWFIVEQETRPPYKHPISPYVNLVLQTVFLFTFAFLLDSLKRALDREKRLSNQDPVTGLGNRRAFYQRTGFEMDRAQRYQHRFTVAYIDLDDFKLVNDRHGHDQGDRLLRLVADTLRTGVRKTDFVARLGGTSSRCYCRKPAIARPGSRSTRFRPSCWRRWPRAATR
jgi:predicted signal transduction protein with EAL and GGDEF domain